VVGAAKRKQRRIGESTMETTTTTQNAIDLLTAYFGRARPLANMSGRRNRYPRARIASVLHGRRIAESAPEAQWGRLRAALLHAAGIGGEGLSRGAEDARFAEILAARAARAAAEDAG